MTQQRVGRKPPDPHRPLRSDAPGVCRCGLIWAWGGHRVEVVEAFEQAEAAKREGWKADEARKLGERST